MQSAGLSSYRKLSKKAGVSEKQLRRLRRGEIERLRLVTLQRISQGLEISLGDLLEIFGTSGIPAKSDCPRGTARSDRLPSTFNDGEVLEKEYQQLLERLETQKALLLQEFQISSLQTIESWLLQWSAVCHAVQNNPQIPAERLLKIVQPIEKLLEEWGIEAIAQVGAEIPYDPQQHQLMDGAAKAGDLVRVRYAGYKQRDKLLYRAKVSPIG